MRTLLAAVFVVAANLQALAETPVACGSGPMPPGKRITDQRLLMGFGITGSKVALHETDKQGILVYAAPQWCKESDFSAGGQQFVIWHNRAADEHDVSGPVDRVTKVGVDPDSGDGLVVYSLADRLASKLSPTDGQPTFAVVYHIEMELKDEIWIVGSYDAPPTREELARFASGGYAPINVRIDKKSRKTTLYAPT